MPTIPNTGRTLVFLLQLKGFTNIITTIERTAEIHTPLPPASNEATIESVAAIVKIRLKMMLLFLLIKNKHISPKIEAYRVTFPDPV